MSRYEDDETGLTGMVEALVCRGEFFHGEDPKKVAQEWLDAGFTPWTAARWMDSGVWQPSTATVLRRMGKTPKHLHDVPASTVYAWCNGDEKVSFADYRKAIRDAKRDEKRDHLARFADIANDDKAWYNKSYFHKEKIPGWMLKVYTVEYSKCNGVGMSTQVTAISEKEAKLAVWELTRQNGNDWVRREDIRILRRFTRLCGAPRKVGG